MRIGSVQPPYPYTLKDVAAHQQFIMEALDKCDDSYDLIVLPECCNAPTSCGKEDYLQLIRENTPVLLEKVRNTARRCRSMVAINLYAGEEAPYRNATLLFDREGELRGKYDKQHLPKSELSNPMIDHSYISKTTAPYTVELEGVKFAFLTCYDCYFNEYIQRIAYEKPDVVIMSAYQRGERGDMIETEVKNIAFNCNAYAIRSSVSMGGDTVPNGAHTMVAAPDGKVLGCLGQKTGILTVDFDVHFKHTRENGFGQNILRNDTFIVNGRTPWIYRTAGPACIPGDSEIGYPRVCSHRGFNSYAPENTMPAFGMAVALGAVEIELDLWPSKDHHLVVCHDAKVDRTSDGHGKICELNWDEISQMNIGAKYAPEMNGLHFPLFEDVLARFSRQTIINLHIKSVGGVDEYDHNDFANILELLHRYDMEQHVYISGEEDVLKTSLKMAPDLPRCALDGKRDGQLVHLARDYGCKKLQLFRWPMDKDWFTYDMIDDANASGIRCNLFFSDDPEDAVRMIRRGVSTILTNDYLRISTAVKKEVGGF